MKTKKNFVKPQKLHVFQASFSFEKAAILLFTSLLLFNFQPVFSQSQFQTVFSQPAKSLGAQSICQDSDGYIIANSTGLNETTIIKTNSRGVIVWNKTFYGMASKIIPVSTGGYIIVGKIIQTAQQVGFVTKITSSGTSIWSKVFDTYDSFGIAIEDIIETVDGSNQAFAITGTVHRKLVGGVAMFADVLCFKITNAGNIIWIRAYGRNTYELYNNLHEYGRNIHEVASSDPLYPDYFITGHSDNYNNNENGSLYLVKVDGSDGSMLFDRIYYCIYPIGHVSYQDLNSHGISMIDIDGNIVVALQSGLTKLSNTGAITWSKDYSGVYGFYSIACNSSGYIGANSGGSIFKLTTAGAISWGKNYCPYTGDVITTTDGGYAVVGGIPVSDESNNNGCLLVKTNSSGQSACYETTATSSGSSDLPLKVETPNGDDPDISSEIYIVDGTGETAICLNTYDRVCTAEDDFEYVSGDPVSFTVSEATIGTKTLYYINEADETWPENYIMKWTLIESVAGNAVYTDVTDHSDDDANTYYSTLRTNSGFRYFINPTVRTDKSLCVDVTSAGCRARECFGANPVIGGGNFREAANDASVNVIEDISDVSAYPNPAKDNVILLIPNGEASVVDIFDISGRKVKTLSVNGIENSLYVGDLSSGLYILNIIQSKGSTNVKLQIK